ncbi:MAG: ubiquinone/menaquinone biosynthesis methyltransferase [uncultured bacterium]|nr:MAG: ubiquinone/menaquinone biosynthesis methyltransferase [uncultured bacterium]
MSKDHEWEKEKSWIEADLKGLYPPNKITKIQGALELIRDENFSGKKVLDNGCGAGWFGKIIQDKGAEVIGTDISDALLEEASKYIPTKKASSCELPFGDQAFDYIVSIMVLHIFDDPDQTIEESWRVLKPGGKFYVGIVHPMADKWNEETGLCYLDPASYDKIEERTWIFNLTDGRKFTKHYLHRPLSFYESKFSRLFMINRKLEPKLPEKMRENGKYASTEYLFFELIKK